MGAVIDWDVVERIVRDRTAASRDRYLDTLRPSASSEIVERALRDGEAASREAQRPTQRWGL